MTNLFIAKYLSFPPIIDHFFIAVFWSTWWFQTGIFLIFSGAALILLRKRIKKLKHENALATEKLEEGRELLNYSKENEQKAKDEVENVNKLKNELLSKLSHEIRTPMNGIIGMASLLTDTPLNSEQREYAETIVQCGENLMEVINTLLISDVLNYSNSSHEKMDIEYKDFYLPSVIEDTLNAFAGKIDQNAVELLYCIDPNVPAQIVTDPQRLKQVLMNVLESSVSLTSKGEIFTRVYLARTIDRNQVEIGFEVKDTGMAVSKSEMELLNKELSEINMKYEGTGLGLMIGKKLLNMMGGDLHIENKPSEGNIFKATILARVSLQPQRSTAHIELLKQKKILVIDDNHTALTITKKLLEQHKTNVSLAESAERAWEILRKNHDFDLIIVDMHLHEMNAIELMHLLRDHQIKIPAILLTTKEDDQYNDYPDLFKTVLTKPAKHSLLIQLISDLFLPAEKNSPEVSNSKQKISQEFSKKFPLRILIAEDNVTNQQIAAMFLKKLGYDPDFANNGQEALEMVSEINYDLIFMDVQMPVMDGLETTRMMRLCLNEQPVIIAMTANAMQGDRQECLEAGMDDYISKPIKLENMLRMLEKWAIKTKEQQ